jgi:hypothetical protein
MFVESDNRCDGSDSLRSPDAGMACGKTALADEGGGLGS